MKRARKFLTGFLFCIPLLVSCDFPILTDIVMDPGSPRGISVLHVSDLHMKARDPLYDRMVDRIGQNAPDLIVFTGDLVESAEALPILSEYMKRLPSAAPKYAVLGNWEYQGEVPVTEYRAALLSCGVTLLVNETADIDVKGTPVRIHGMDDYLGGVPSFAGFIPDSGALNLVLAHCPVLFDALVSAHGSTGIPIYMLSGHTHGGQVTFFGLPLILPEGCGRHCAGEYANGACELHVSRGIGKSNVDFRLFADPEIPVYEF